MEDEVKAIYIFILANPSIASLILIVNCADKHNLELLTVGHGSSLARSPLRRMPDKSNS